MTIEEDIFTRSTTHAGLSALISTRCFPDRLEEDVTLPALVFNRVSTVNDAFRTHDLGPTALGLGRWQFSCYATTSKGAKDVGDQVYAAWDGYQDGCDIGSSFQANRISQREDALNMYREILDFMIL